MRQRLRDHLSYGNVMSTLALVIALGTGTAYATHEVINSSDVVNESLLSEDLRNGSAVRGADVVDASLRGADVRNNSLTGDDISEATLGQVPAATLGGKGRSAASPDDCNPDSEVYVRCVTVQLDLQAPARVLLNGRVTVFGDYPQCRWGGVVESGPVGALNEISLVGLTGIIPAGSGWTFAIECSEPDSGQPVYYKWAWITAVAISPS